jgi:hypothetical protein
MENITKEKWYNITNEHIVKAIEEFENSPNKYHAARNTFLIYKGNKYPAKTIRGLAYKIANNETLGSDQYSGGMETVKFFERYGFSVEHAGYSIAAKKKSEVKAQRKKLNVVSQKNALQKLLQQKFGIIETEKNYEWLKTPDPDNPPQEYKDIIKGLVEYRNQGGFLKSSFHPPCDFVFEDHKLMFEYDEYQHFSQARKIALENYPETIHVYFSKSDWVEQCTKIRAKDNFPFDRDERRAYYDSVRDIEADKYGYKLFRIKHDDFDWEDTNASAYLDTLLSKTYGQNYSDQMHVTEVNTVLPEEEKEKATGDQGIKIGLVSMILNSTDTHSIDDHATIFLDIVNTYENLDIIVFPGWTLLKDQLALVEKDMKNKHSLILFEVWDDFFNGEIKRKGYYFKDGVLHDKDIIQKFETSSEINRHKDLMKPFLHELKDKRIIEYRGMSICWLICGEINVLRNIQKNNNEVTFRFPEDADLARAFQEIYDKTDIFIDPTHTIMGNQGKLARRREFLSQNKTFCSVSNADTLTDQKLSNKSIQYLYKNGKPINGRTLKRNDRFLLIQYNV